MTTSKPSHEPHGDLAPITNDRLPDWKRPHGVAAGTWAYVQSVTIAGGYDDFVSSAPMTQPEADWLAGHFPPSRSDKTSMLTVADFGCGTGRVSLRLANDGYGVLGLDLSQPMLDQLATKASQAGLSSMIETRRVNLAELHSMPADRVDHGVCLFATLGMIQGRQHRREFLRQAFRMIRSNGRLLIHVHHCWAMLAEPSVLKNLLRQGYRAWAKKAEWGDSVYAYRGLPNMFMHRFTRRELVEDLRQAGFKIDEVLPLSLDAQSIVSKWRLAGGYFVTAIVPAR